MTSIRMLERDARCQDQHRSTPGNMADLSAWSRIRGIKNPPYGPSAPPQRCRSRADGASVPCSRRGRTGERYRVPPFATILLTRMNLARRGYCFLALGFAPLKHFHLDPRL